MGDDEAAFCTASGRVGKFEAQRERCGLLFCDLVCSRISIQSLGWTLPLERFPALDLSVVMRILSLLALGFRGQLLAGLPQGTVRRCCGGAGGPRAVNSSMCFGTVGAEVTHQPGPSGLSSRWSWASLE